MGGANPADLTLAGRASSISLRSREEICAAINDLSTADLHSLKKFAIWTASGCPGAWDHNDLLQESIRATLDDDRRHWSASVDFVTHLRGCIRSLAHSWRKRSCLDNATAAASGTSQVSSDEPRLIASQMIDRILGLFRGDPVASAIVEALMDREPKNETTARLGITQNVYEAARKRIGRRIASSAYARGGSNVQ